MSSLRQALELARQTARISGLLWTAALIADRLLPIGILGWWADRTVSAATLAQQIESVLRAWGMSPEDAAITVGHMMYADLHGIDSHGCSMLLHYHRERAQGLLNMTPTIALLRETETTGLIDGGSGLGHVPADMAMRLAIDKCRAAGMSAVAVRNSGHYGAAGAYAAMAAQAGLLGLATTNARAPAIVPTLGDEAMLGTNPLAFAAPGARNSPFLLDMATSTASLGKLGIAWRRGRRLPAGWALARGGGSLRNARVAVEQRRLAPLGSSLEMGGHKGYGLATMVEVLSAVLSGARGPDGTANGIGHFFLCIDPQRFAGDGEFESSLDRLVDSLRASRPLEAARPVMVAGDPERQSSQHRSQHGIPLPRGVVEDIRAVAHAAGVPFLLDR